MHFQDGKLLFSATDLTDFAACRHLTQLERLRAQGLAKRPFFDDPMLEFLRERGLEHERQYIDSLRQAGKNVVEIDKQSPAAFDETLGAMQAGVDVVVQARLEHGTWAGWSDALLRVPGESHWGDYLYEPVETKLAKETRGATLIQLCLYGELLAGIQGVSPERLQVVVPGVGFASEKYRFEEYRAYFHLIRRNFERELEKPLPGSVEEALPYPDPVSHCDVCNWHVACHERWSVDDHLSLVAGIQKLHRKELASWEITTLAGLAQLPLPLTRKPSRGSAAAIERVREQARLQLEARTTGNPTYELLSTEEKHGLAALPLPSELDLFLDLEGIRYAENGGFEYLFGYALRDASGCVVYEALWALSPTKEKQAFERLIDLIGERRSQDPTMHVYHYAPYEPTAMKRLMGRYATRADELDDLLRAEVFVDLYSVVRKGLRAGIDSYTIKKLEPFYGLTREIDLRLASRLRRAVEYAIAKKDVASLSAKSCEAVQAYNRDDCISALELRDWLESLRREAERRDGKPVPRLLPRATEVGEVLEDRLARIRAVSNMLIERLPVERNGIEEAQWILAHLLEWHRREDKVTWWEFFRLNQMTDDELLDEREGIAGLQFVERIKTTPRGVVIDRYSFPAQDTDFDDRDEAFEPGGERRSRFASVETIDLEQRTIDLKKGKDRSAHHPTVLFKHDLVTNQEVVESLLRLGEFVCENGIDGTGHHRAARDLLLRHNPRLVSGAALRSPGESVLDSARRVVLALEGGCLAIQGPPGTGKTYTGARMIVSLVRAGKRVGITAVSHKVIRNLLDEVVEAAKEERVSVRCMHRVSQKSTTPSDEIEEETDAGRAVEKILSREYGVVGGTAWVWSRENLACSVDVLFVDEAGQMSLANVLACAQSAESMVLLGDPQQLEQPQKANHPEGAELSALKYLLEDHDTMPEARGLFLGETWRLHPSICRFTSDLFYEGKLAPHAGLDAQSVSGPTIFAGAGLFYVPVEHEGNRNVSEEEAAKVAEIVSELTAPGVAWTKSCGERKPMTLEQILIVAPYNAQVSAIAERIPGARIGTVDKFQGQEAPVVIYSMATSSSEEAPRGMEFLFSRHRLNVATSRARCVCILVSTSRLFELECHSPEQMRLASAFCAYLERAAIR